MDSIYRRHLVELAACLGDIALLPCGYGINLLGNTKGGIMNKPLTNRERDILKLICRGKTNQDIAGELGTSLSTIKNQVSSILTKLGVRNRVEALLVALSKELL